MNIEEVREYALSMNEQVTELLFADKWLSWRICGKWFLLTELDTPEPWVSVKLKPEDGERLRERDLERQGLMTDFGMKELHESNLEGMRILEIC